MTDPENTAMNGNQRAFRQASPDFLRRDAGANELSARYDSVRPAGELSQFPFDRADLLFHNNS